MVRKLLFLGLTGMLAVVLGYLVVQGRREDRRQQQNLPSIEVVRESKPSLTRVVEPEDLRIVDSRMQLSPDGLQDKHVIVMRNDGQTRYKSFRVRLTYLDRGGRILGTRVQEIREAPQPAQTYSSTVLIDDVPAGAARAAVNILSADMESSGPASK